MSDLNEESELTPTTVKFTNRMNDEMKALIESGEFANKAELIRYAISEFLEYEELIERQKSS